MKEYRKIPSLKFMYEVSKDGIIRNVKSKKILKQRDTPNSKYLFIHTSLKGKTIDIGVHRLVAECWCEIPEGYSINELEVNHIDFNVKNNNASNLEWVTTKENREWSKINGRLQGINKGKPGYWKGKHLSDSARTKISEYRKCKNKIKAIYIKDKSEYIFNSLDEAEEYIRKLLNKESKCVRGQIILGCKGERKVVYKHNWYFI